ncbi:MAG: hypothetical protein M1813_009742 [Trichoglossum hirsutum]|nr:MAG: hypothetical protein M1813_009742 [Trichoglossum hirsutum]
MLLDTTAPFSDSSPRLGHGLTELDMYGNTLQGQLPPFEEAPSQTSADTPPRNSNSALNTQDDDGKTRLHQAVIQESEEQARRLLLAGAAVDIKDYVGNQPLHYAAIGGFDSLVKLLLRFGANPDVKGQLGRTPLHMSLHANRTAEIMLTANPIVSSQDENGDTPLHIALSTLSTDGHHPIWKSIVTQLVKAGTDVNVANTVGVTPFHLILGLISMPHLLYLDLFLRHGADVSSRTRDERLPFQMYLSRQPCPDENVVEHFLNNGADPDARLESGELLFHYCFQRKIHTLDRNWKLGLRLCQTVNVNQAGRNGNYPLHEVTLCTDAAVYIKILLARKANPNQLNQFGYSPLMLLLSCEGETDVTEITEILLAGGADPMQPDLRGNLPIYAAARNYRDREPVLRKLGALLLTPNTNSGGAIHNPSPTGIFAVPNGQEWWQRWDLVRKKHDWDAPKRHLTDAKGILPGDVETDVCQMALSSTAEYCLERAKMEFASLDQPRDVRVGEHRKYIANILRDCRGLQLYCEEKWYDYLLDLC